MNEFLASTEVIDWRHPDIVAQAKRLATDSPLQTARNCFEFVRDEIRHTGDEGSGPITWRASDVLTQKTGFCYAKSHLLAALWRACGLPGGLCYQRLAISDQDPPRFALHGVAAVALPDHGWYRADPRGNKPGIDAQFSPPTERLAFTVSRPGEADLPGVHAEPLGVVLAALQNHETCDRFAKNLPDLDPAIFAAGSGDGADARSVRVVLPYHLRLLAGVTGDVVLEVPQPVTQRSVLDALEARYPGLRGTIRDHVTQRRRAFLRLYACELDLSNESPDTPLPTAVASGEAPYQIVSAIAGG